MTGGGKDMIVIRAKIDGGPYNGKSFFTNLVLSPENDIAVSIFLRQIGVLGANHAELAAENDGAE